MARDETAVTITLPRWAAENELALYARLEAQGRIKASGRAAKRAIETALHEEAPPKYPGKHAGCCADRRLFEVTP